MTSMNKPKEDSFTRGQRIDALSYDGRDSGGSMFSGRYRCTKHYPHSVGLSTCFRQWKSPSHCAHLHGYALAFKFEMEAYTLDDRDWVVDFGSFKNLKSWLEMRFDHRMIIAADDPLLDHFKALHKVGGCNLWIVPRVGIESFAEYAGTFIVGYLHNMTGDRVRLISASCSEHEGNSAIWLPDALPLKV
jgi:6-pyruvoyltetrahydropterin/6-carboxytetrahydropterin synthase